MYEEINLEKHFREIVTVTISRGWIKEIENDEKDEFSIVLKNAIIIPNKEDQSSLEFVFEYKEDGFLEYFVVNEKILPLWKIYYLENFQYDEKDGKEYVSNGVKYKSLTKETIEQNSTVLIIDDTKEKMLSKKGDLFKKDFEKVKKFIETKNFNYGK